MRSFRYTITKPEGICGRPAGLLVREVRRYPDHRVTISLREKSVNALKLMAVIQMGVTQGDTVSISVDGEMEEETAAALEVFCKANL